jgi:hypothetical protein
VDVIIHIELTDTDWGHVCGALDAAAADSELYVEQNDEIDGCDEEEVDSQLTDAAESRRIAAYITTSVNHAYERARVNFSNN